MSRCISRFAEVAAFGLACSLLLAPAVALAQACCAGAAALTPGRLAMHEQALVGVQVRAAIALGSFDADGAYATTPAHSSELDLEQDLFGALRVTKHGQLALLVPFLEAQRSDRNGSELGGGVGDINLSARYDFFAAGRSRYVPGIAVLGGVTFPSGTPVESAGSRLATGATGVGVVQGNFGLALEQIYDRWLIDLTGLVALRASRSVQGIDDALAPQWTGIGAVAYSFENGASLGISVAYSAEADSSINGKSAPGTARRRTWMTLSGLWPLSDKLRLQGNLLWDPPISSLGKNQTQNIGIGAAVIYSFT
jgi:hypothetical protein